MKFYNILRTPLKYLYFSTCSFASSGFGMVSEAELYRITPSQLNDGSNGIRLLSCFNLILDVISYYDSLVYRCSQKLSLSNNSYYGHQLTFSDIRSWRNVFFCLISLYIDHIDILFLSCIRWICPVTNYLHH